MIPYKFIYRTTRRDFKVVEVGDSSKNDISKYMVEYDYVISLKAVSPIPNLEPNALYNLLIERGWLKITKPINAYEAADIERICLYADRNQQNFYYNRQGEFDLIYKENKQTVNYCSDENYDYLF